MFKRMFIMLLLCGLVLGGVFGFKMYGMKMMMQHMAAMGSPPQTVSTIKVAYDSWEQELRAVGTLRAVKGTDVAAEVAGTVENIFVDSGQDVEEGTLLLQLRSQEDQAQLAALEANLRLAELTLARAQKQIAVKAISQAAADEALASFESLTAQVAQQKALLEKKAILAPFAGRLGLRLVDVGQFLAVGTPLFTLQQLDPIYVDFSVPQQDLPKLAVGQKIGAQTDAFPDKVFEGKISAIDAKIDESTRNVNVRATMSNPDKLLRPGMFATVALQIGEPEKFLTLPQTSITFNPYGSTVFLAKKGKDGSLQASMSFIKTGATRGDQVAVLSGIEEGDEVVTSGQLKLRNGTPLAVNNKVQPSNDPAPAPEDK